jgi:transcriptional regulator with GAF, ATPase, and Fis domain
VCEGLSALLKEAGAQFPICAIGLVRPDDSEHVLFTCADALGVAAYRLRIAELPDPVRPGATGVIRLTRAELEADLAGPLGTRLQLSGYADDVRNEFASREGVALPIHGLDPPSVVIVGVHEPGWLDANSSVGVESLARSVADLLKRTEAPEAQLARLRRLEAANAGLPALFRALDVRDIFDRLSVITKGVLPHDLVVLALYSDDLTQVNLYAQTSDSRLPETVKNPWPPVQIEGWVYRVVDDLAQHPIERTSRWSGFGIRSSIRIAIRFDDGALGVLNFSSREVAPYGSTDVAIGLHIANYVSIAMSHQRLAEKLSAARERGRVLAQQADEARTRSAQLETRIRTLTDELNARSGYHRVIGESASWREVLTQATKVASTESTVLLLGESGTGKEVVARFIHRASPRKRGPFVALNCAALPEHLLEAELFGYERGAFTGAAQTKPGQLEQAAGGTLFLDEVAEMTLSAQAKFLRVLQEREFQRLGGTRVIKADARIVAATNRDLESAMERGQFRDDLYYRLNVFAIQLPALRDRREDILLLSEAFLADLAQTLGRPSGGISTEARRALMEYHWPGNVRELRNILERAAILSDGGLIVAEHLAFRPATGKSARPAMTAAQPPPTAVDGGDLKAVERALIEKAMLEARFNKSQAAKQLGVTRAQLYAKLRRYGLD